MSTSAVPAIVDELRTVFAAAMSDVGVYSGPVERGEHTDLLVLDEIEFDQDQETYGTENRSESFTVRSVIYAEKPGSGEEQIKAARDRVFAIFDHAETALIAGVTVSGVNVRDGEIVRGRLENIVAPSVRGCRLYFDIYLRTEIG